MLHEFRLTVEFFAWLEEGDRKLAGRVAELGCPHCGGPLHQGNYERKPRGALVAAAAEGFRLRYSLCCGREGCRRRVLPPSLRFLGRRVYVEAVVLIATVVELLLGGPRPASRVTEVPARTLTRWARWWQGMFPGTETFAEVRARLVPPPEAASLPRSLYGRVDEELSRSGSGRSPGDVCVVVAQLLAPCTTVSMSGVSRFMRGLLSGWVPETSPQKMAQPP